VFHGHISFRASIRVLSALDVVGVAVISRLPHFTTGIGWALRVGLYCLQRAQHYMTETWCCIADFTIQIGSKKALLVLRVPASALKTGKALTLKQVEVIGISVRETWNGTLVKTYLRSLFQRCGWPSQVVSDCGPDIKKGIVDTLLEAPNGASWISDITHVVANALKHYYADLSLFQQFQKLCTDIRQRLQQTRLAFLLPPKARSKGRFLNISRQAEWGLRTIAYLDEKQRQHAPDASDLAWALRGLKPFKAFLTNMVRHTRCLNQVMKVVKTQGLTTNSIQTCQEMLGTLPARSPIRKEVSDYLEQYVPEVESTDGPLLGSSDVLESLIGKAKQRLDPNGRSEINKSILLIPSLCGEITQELVTEALRTVHVQDVTTWVSKTVGETMRSVRRREFPPSRAHDLGSKTAELRAGTG
jgi:hypothetical protein